MLVHGGWVGGWFWERVLGRLLDRGVSAAAPTLIGHAERAGEGHADISLDDHTADVVAAIDHCEADRIALVGHSYGGVVATTALEHIPEKIAELIYLDGFVPTDGESLEMLVGSRLTKLMRYFAANHGDGWRVPLPIPLDGFGLDDPAEVERFMRRLTPGLLNVISGVVRMRRPEAARIPRRYIACVEPAMALLRPSRERARAAAWPYLELRAGHAAPISHPDLVVEALLSRAGSGV